MRGKCIHPRKMVNTMREFLQQASDITFIDEFLPPAPKGIDKMEWFFNRDNWKSQELLCAIRITKLNQNNFCAYISEYDDEDDTILHFGYSPDLLKNPYQRRIFTSDFRHRFPSAKGFMGITLILLHELGHFQTNEKCLLENPEYNRPLAIFEARTKAKNIKDLNLNYYFRLPDENYATEWAINWLKDPEHRKIAKKFEKKFLECFEKTS